MDIPTRLVESAAHEIAEVDGHASSVQPCGDATYEQMARTATVAVLAQLAEAIEIHAVNLPKNVPDQIWQGGRTDGLYEAVEMIVSWKLEIEEQ